MSTTWVRPLYAAGIVLATAGVLSVIGGVSFQQVAVVTIAAACGFVVALAIRGAAPLLMLYAVAVIGSSGGWLAYTLESGPWTSAALTWWAAITFVLTPCYPAIVAHRERLQERAVRVAEESALRRRQGVWVALWSRAGVKGLRQTGEEPTRAGLKLYFDLPQDGRVKASDMERAAQAVEIAHGALRRGAIEVEGGSLAHEVIVHVNAIDVLSQTIPIPADVSPRTGDQPFDVGQHEDGGATLLDLDKHIMIAAITGAGKTNLISAIIKQVGRLVDTIIWVIDPKGGRLAAIWLQAWADGLCDRPVIDWVATTDDEWDRMLDAAERIRVARSHARVGGEKVTATPLTPRILIVVDELADVTAVRTDMAKLKRLAQKGRSEEIKLILVGTRGTVTIFGDGDLKSQLGNRIGLGVAQVSDAQQIFPDDVGIAKSLARMQHPGCMYVKAGPGSRAMPSKAHRITHEQTPQFAIALADLRPGLDRLSADAAGRAYAERWEWERCGHLITVHAQPLTEPANEEEAFAAIVAAQGTPVPPILVVLDEIFEAGRAEKLHTQMILDRLPPGAGELTAKRLSMLLQQVGVFPVEAWEEPDGTRGRGYRRVDIETARKRIAGGTRVPAAVYAWPADSSPNP